MSESCREIFVPGRLAIIGEHTDWACTYRKQNPTVGLGLCLVCVTSEGLYASFRRSSFCGITYRSTDLEGIERVFQHSFDIDGLHDVARGDGFFAYVAGSMAAVLESTNLLATESFGIEIVNHKTTLPMKKGLSSSAAICVLIVTCCDKLYNLSLDRDAIMTIAYKGEKKTKSNCGMMDFCVVMGANSVGLMTMNENAYCGLEKLIVKKTHYFVVADLKAGKNTVEILRQLNACFPFAKNADEALMHEYVRLNESLCADAVRAIGNGDIHKLAAAMTQAQSNFDAGALLVCPQELTAPKLHAVLSDPVLKQMSLAAKGVGSQGDGSVQVLCSTPEQQHQVLHYLRQMHGCEGFVLTVPATEAT